MSSDRDATQLGEILYTLWDALKDHSRREARPAIFHHWVSDIVFRREGTDDEAVSFEVKGKRYTFRCAGFWDSSGTYRGVQLPDGRVARTRLTLFEDGLQLVFAMTRPGEVELLHPGEWGNDLLALAASLDALARDRMIAMMLNLCRLGYWPHGWPSVEDDKPRGVSDSSG